MNLDPRCKAAVDLAKRALGENEPLGIGLLMEALYFETNLSAAFPRLASYLDQPRPRREDPPDRVPVTEELKPLLMHLVSLTPPPGPQEFFWSLADSDAGRAFLCGKGLTAEALDEALNGIPQEAPEEAFGGGQTDEAATAGDRAWRASPTRRETIAALSPYGRMLTDGVVDNREAAEFGDAMTALVRTLCRMRRRNAIVLGHPGTGKSALIYELARRISAGDDTLPAALRSCDIFELSPTFLRSGASLIGQYEERVKDLLSVLGSNLRVILFVDEIHGLFQSGIHSRGPYSEANEAFKGALSRGEITCIGCTALGEYRHFIEPDQALDRRFAPIKLDPPTTEQSVAILRRRLPQFQRYYDSLAISEEILGRVVALTDEHLPARMQPDKSIQLLDDACAYCVTARPPLNAVTEETLLRVLEDMLGAGLVRRAPLTEDGVFEALRQRILGQDPVLRELARAFIAGRGGWKRSQGPRGVYVFGGPTGVGKTQTALRLAEILGGGTARLLRIDCNTLQGSAHDAGPVTSRLLGVPPGYVGYTRGQGGILSRIRDIPESIVLFDELEKAASGLGKLLLQIFDSGQVEDVEGNVLDFRRAYIVMTTNLGCTYDRRTLGFAASPQPASMIPAADRDALCRELRQVGYGEEFIGRLDHIFLFAGLAGEAVREILVHQLDALRALAAERNLALTWSERLVDHLMALWQPRLGVRHLSSILNHRINEQIAVAEAHGEMQGVTAIELDVIAAGDSPQKDAWVGLAMRERRENALVIRIF